MIAPMMTPGGGKINVYESSLSCDVDHFVEIEENMDLIVFKGILERFLLAYNKGELPLSDGQ